MGEKTMFCTMTSLLQQLELFQRAQSETKCTAKRRDLGEKVERNGTKPLFSFLFLLIN